MTSSAGKVTHLKNAQYLDYEKLGKQLKELENNAPRWIPQESLPLLLKELAEAQNSYRNATPSDYDTLLKAYTRFNHVDQKVIKKMQQYQCEHKLD